jgi:hypothetical protein
VRPGHGKVFYIRSLLFHRAAWSFDQLRTIDGILYDSFQKAAQAAGIFDESDEGEKAMEDAILQYRSPAQLRFLFVLLIREGAPALPLWERFGNDLAKDFSNGVDTFVSAPAKMLALEAIECLLQEHGKSTVDFALPHISVHSAEIHHELSYFAPQARSLHTTAQSNISIMTPDQLSIYNKLYDAVFSTSPLRHKLHFLTGKAGRGKSFTIDTLVAKARSEGVIPIVMGTTALSMSNHPLHVLLASHC